MFRGVFRFDRGCFRHGDFVIRDRKVSILWIPICQELESLMKKDITSAIIRVESFVDSVFSCDKLSMAMYKMPVVQDQILFGVVSSGD